MEHSWDSETAAEIIEELNVSYARFLRESYLDDPIEQVKAAFKCGWLLGVKYGIKEGYKAGCGEDLV